MPSMLKHRALLEADGDKMHTRNAAYASAVYKIRLQDLCAALTLIPSREHLTVLS